MAALDEMIEELQYLADSFDLGEDFGGSDGEYQYATGKYEAYSHAAHMLSQWKGK